MPAPFAPRLLPALLAAFACALILGLSLLPPSSTRIQAWPWALFASAGWLLPVAVALWRLGIDRPHARFGGPLDAGFALLVLTAVASALLSPLRGAVMPHLLPLLGACALPYALLPWLQPPHLDRTLRIGGLLIFIILAASLLLWLEPWAGLAGLGSRNAQPFGHANTTGSVAVLAATWLAFCAIRGSGRTRLPFIFGIVLAAAVAVSSESRGAVLALAAAGGTAAAISLLQRGRPLVLIMLVVVLAGTTLAANARLRDLVLHGRWSASARESNDQRTAMLLGGIRLGAGRPVAGWGAGSIPHVFPRVRANLPGTADNFLQLHNTPVQLWATLGAAGLLAALLLVAGMLTGLRAAPWTRERIVLASGIVGASTVLLFDHPFATPVFTVLAAVHLAAWAAPSTRGPERERRDRPLLAHGRLAACGGLLLLAPVLFATARDLAARSAYAGALDQAASHDLSGYASSLDRAMILAPGDPYYPQLLASHLATARTPRAPDTAILLLRSTLAANPDVDYAHYNLGWLLLDSDPASAGAHFLDAARLAPHRGAVYLGLGFSRIQLNDTNGAVRAFAAEWLLDPAFAWSPLWHQPPLDALRPRIRALANEEAGRHGLDPWAALETPATTGAPYRRLRTGYGVLMGHPDGTPPADVNIQARVILPPELRDQVPPFGWLSGRTLLEFISRPSP